MATIASVTYREASEDDVEALHDVARATWKHDYPSVVNREVVTDTVEEWYAEDELTADVRREDALVLVAKVDDGVDDLDGDVVGFVHGVVDGDCGVLLRAYVHPAARGEGLGRGLVDAAFDAFSERGCDRAEAMVLARNEPGNAFYDALGFEHVATDSTTIGGEGYDENVYFRYI